MATSTQPTGAERYLRRLPSATKGLPAHLSQYREDGGLRCPSAGWGLKRGPSPAIPFAHLSFLSRDAGVCSQLPPQPLRLKSFATATTGCCQRRHGCDGPSEAESQTRRRDVDSQDRQNFRSLGGVVGRVSHLLGTRRSSGGEKMAA